MPYFGKVADPFGENVIVSTLSFWRRSSWVSYFLPIA